MKQFVNVVKFCRLNCTTFHLKTERIALRRSKQLVVDGLTRAVCLFTDGEIKVGRGGV